MKTRLLVRIIFLILVASWQRAIYAQEEKPSEDVSAPVFVDAYQSDGEMDAPTSVEVTFDGKFIYASAYNSASHLVFRRDEKTGKLEHVQTIQDPEWLNGATALRLSKEGDLAATAAFRSNSVVLYARDAESGRLTRLDGARNGVAGVSGLDFAVDAKFSPDGRFVYAIDATGGVAGFRIVDEEGDKKDEKKLEFIESNRDESLEGARGLAFHPSGQYMFVAADRAGTLVVLKRDTMSGKSKIVQVLRDGEDGVEGLGGAFGVDVDQEGRFVYTTSGRFRGDHAVGVFEFDQEEEKLTPVQEIIAGAPAEDEEGKENAKQLAEFEGGNEIVISPDGKYVYTIGTTSASLAVLKRNKKTGKLTVAAVISGKEPLDGASGVAVSPDGQFIYVAAENHDAVSVYRASNLNGGK